MQEGKSTSPLAGKLLDKTYLFDKNSQELESIRIEPKQDGSLSIVMKSAGKEQRLECSTKAWTHGQLSLGGWPLQPIATCGGWTDDETFTVKACLYETPFCLTSKLHFVGDLLHYDSESNVGFGQTKREQLVGKVLPR